MNTVTQLLNCSGASYPRVARIEITRNPIGILLTVVHVTCIQLS